MFVVAVILPPLGVFLERGCVCDLCINIALTCLGYIPGISKWKERKINLWLY
ncbi:MAG: YqaE/Pmp3 family membrane protein [Paenibacillus sp.]|nr:YqaE/Pmp3 family membrane protein [Paenibacillus sp.]